MSALPGPSTDVGRGGPTRPPRLVATDLDGTLLRDDGTVSVRTAAVLRAMHESQVDVVFVTARPPRWVDEVAHAVAGHGVVICLNGAFVYDARHRRVLEQTPLDDHLVRALVGDLRLALGTPAFSLERASGFAAEAAFDLGPHPRPPGAPVAETVEELLDGGTGKLLARCPGIGHDELVARVHEVLAGRAVVADSGSAGLAEISGPGVTKGATLARWAAERGIGPHEVWAFGDMPNDLPMLTWAGRSFAVANAHPEVRAVVDEVCASNQEDGVAARLEELVAGGGAR